MHILRKFGRTGVHLSQHGFCRLPAEFFRVNCVCQKVWFFVFGTLISDIGARLLRGGNFWSAAN